MTPDILTTIFSPFNLLMMNIGMAAGIIIGALPGLSAVIAITILLPVTFGLESIPGMYMPSCRPKTSASPTLADTSSKARNRHR